MITRLVVLGATGDLAGRFLLPALARLHAEGQLPDGLRIAAAAQQDWDDETYGRYAARRLQEHAEDVPTEVRQGLLECVSYRPVDLEDPSNVAAVVHSAQTGGGGTGAAVAVYLALPPVLFAAAIGALGTAGLPPGSRIAVEKPFGADLDSAVALNALLARVAGSAGEEAVFRVDHVLGMPTVQNLVRLRGADGAWEPVWNSAHLEQVELLWEETLALEGRAEFYDRTGAVKDVVQNHLMQLLALVAMDLPASLGEGDVHDCKVEALRAVRPLTAADVASRTRRGRYTAGQLAGAGGVVPDYAQEDGVDPTRGTETFAELVLELDTPRWAGTRFVLRAGKALDGDRKGVRLHVREGARFPDIPGVEPVSARQLWVDVDDRHSTAPPGGLPAPRPSGELAAYTAVLMDLLSGGDVLSVRGDEAEQAWRIVEPVLQAWADGASPLLEYPAGSSGPPRPPDPPGAADG